ncbi:MAG: carboxypeptidase-like regulatory domain-containing protein [Flavobacteriales bacterium]|nr:carboxypeptidase-like regulatory domain-containing protein [Flavobacteriales bacterium]
MLKHLLQIILTLTLLSQGFTPFAQHKISGTLTDQYQEIVPFAYVSIRGLSHYWNEAARTNLDGFYEFDSLQTGEYEIWFENIGMETQRFTIQLSKDTSLNVSLLDLPYELEEFKVFARSIPLIQKDGEPPVFHDTTGM